MCEGQHGSRKSTLSLKTKVLFLIGKSCSPKEIIAATCIAKTNLALLTKDMASEGLIDKNKGTLDRREVSYIITEKGREYLNSRLAVMEEELSERFVSDGQYGEAYETLLKALALLND